MLSYVLDNLFISENDKFFIIYNKKLDDYNFSKIINDKYKFINLIKINDTKGAVETLLFGIEEIINNYSFNKKCLILDCDTFYTKDIRNIFDNLNSNIVFYTKNYELNPIYSYIKLDYENIIHDIKEKEKISDNANTGAYAFMDINLLLSFCKYVISNNITFKNEPYTSCLISEMIKSNNIFKGYELNEKYVFSLGTPDAVNKYINNTYSFLFDLDGTLVITDDIYFDVWYKILMKYNLTLNESIFTKYIQGNNDKHVLNTLLKNIDLNINDLSNLKDELFIKNINKIKIIDGLHDILKKIKLYGHKICIVTNCNKNVAYEIVKFIGIDKKIDFIISANECINCKPNIEPYVNAIKKYNTNNKKCIIFEDSKTGLLSGKGVNPKLLIGIETIYDSIELKNYGANLSFKNYNELDIEKLLNIEHNNINYLKNIIITSSIIKNIEKININENKLKGGFIADVIGIKIITKDEKEYSQIIKYENKNENNLSSMAKQLELYEREYYFYSTISPNININIPKFYNLLFDENYNKKGIILENLFDKNYKNNLNLNVESIDLTLKIIDRMAKMHSKFWNKNLKNIFPDLKKSTDKLFYPFFKDFIDKKYQLFINKWSSILKNLKLKNVMKYIIILIKFKKIFQLEII